ncbi:MAG: alpha/beta fold hydrolase [Acidimicrobiia bacterium]|nr:alpha/beta fold hydrolase [Acidimicrobiia bacterium]
MRARQPDRQGYIDRQDVKVGFDVYDNHAPTVLLLPTWAIIHSRHWKGQIAYLARHFRVVVIEGRGNGRSDRPTDPTLYNDNEHIADFIAVLDETSTERAVVAGVSQGGHLAGVFAGLHPERVDGAVLIAPATSLTPPHPERVAYKWGEKLDTREGWAKHNQHYWLSNYPDFVDFFFSQIFREPHSTKQHEDSVGWALETDGEVLGATVMSQSIRGDEERKVLASVRCPVLVIHCTEDRIIPHAEGVAVADVAGGDLLTIEGGGHCPQARDPVVVNLAMRRFVEMTQRQRSLESVEVRR